MVAVCVEREGAVGSADVVRTVALYRIDFRIRDVRAAQRSGDPVVFVHVRGVVREHIGGCLRLCHGNRIGEMAAKGTVAGKIRIDKLPRGSGVHKDLHFGKMIFVHRIHSLVNDRFRPDKKRQTDRIYTV